MPQIKMGAPPKRLLSGRKCLTWRTRSSTKKGAMSSLSSRTVGRTLARSSVCNMRTGLQIAPNFLGCPACKFKLSRRPISLCGVLSRGSRERDGAVRKCERHSDILRPLVSRMISSALEYSSGRAIGKVWIFSWSNRDGFHTSSVHDLGLCYEEGAIA